MDRRIGLNLTEAQPRRSVMATKSRPSFDPKSFLAVVREGRGIGEYRSLTLMAFGLDSAIELASAGVLIWRLNVELRHGQGFSERAERTASRIGAVLLFTLAAYIVGGAAWSLWTRHGESFSLPGLIVALLAMPIMTLLARRKIAIATQLGSRAMRADAAESITCGWLSLVVVVGLLADLMLGAWWVDAVTSLVIVGFVVKEAREAWSGEDCCDHC
jgi:divalent metal cation (Fe/Co/Zn/Cd) transporter